MLHEVIRLPQLEDIMKRVLTFEKESDGELTVNYSHNVSLLLPLVSSVLECNIELYLLAERNMIHLAYDHQNVAFAYDHQNYVRYNNNQNISVFHFKEKEHPAF